MQDGNAYFFQLIAYISQELPGFHHYIANLWGFCVCSMIRYSCDAQICDPHTFLSSSAQICVMPRFVLKMRRL